MWVITDNGMEVILGGEFVNIWERYNKDKSISIYKLYTMQNKYKTYGGFRKFYNKISNLLNRNVKLTHLPKWLDKFIK